MFINFFWLARQAPRYYLFVFIISLTGCASLNLPLLPENAQRTQAQAELNFLNGKFREALLEYEHIFDTALSPEDRNAALYGMACTQMMLANTDDQLLEAIANIQRWNAYKGTDNFYENRHLLVLALKQQADVITAKKQENDDREKHKNSVISNQRKKLTEMSSTVKILKHQLDELEAIDEIFQEKRKPL